VFAENLQRLREAAGFTQASFAAKLGVSIRTVQGWEQGKREPDLTVLPVLARELRTTADELVDPTSAGGKPKSKGPAARPRKGK
jgi:transcriptional regulator with XRE-family HTH domain